MTRRQICKVCSGVFLLAGALSCLAFPDAVRAQGDARHDLPHPLKIKSFSVGPDEKLIYPDTLFNLPDEHTTFIPLRGPKYLSSVADADTDTYLVFASAATRGGTGGTVVLQTRDLKTFDFATAEGYADQVMNPPLAITTCISADHINYDNEFDENYSAPGSVVQDPTLPPGNLIMIYEAENHCPGMNWQVPFYATVGLAKSRDNGRTWPGPVNSEFGGPNRHPVLKGVDPEPPYEKTPVNIGDAIPSALVDRNDRNETYLYVVYTYSPGSDGTDDGQIRIARAKFDEDDHAFGEDRWHSDGDNHQLEFMKWHKGGFSEPGIGGLDTGVVPASSECVARHMPDISYNDDLGLYLMIFICNPIPDNGTAAWYYSTATSLDLQDWTEPQMIEHSRHKVYRPCKSSEAEAAPSGDGSQFNGFHPLFMSPGAEVGHTKLTGRVFFLNGCDNGLPRTFTSRTFTITTEP